MKEIIKLFRIIRIVSIKIKNHTVYFISNKKLNWFKNNFKKIIVLVGISTLPLFSTDIYNFGKELLFDLIFKKNEVLLLQLNIITTDLNKDNLEFTYLLLNTGKKRANNLRLKFIVPEGTIASQSPYLELSSELGLTNTIEYRCDRLDNQDTIAICLSFNKEKYQKINSLKLLKNGDRFSNSSILLPHFVYLKYDEGTGYFNKPDTLIYVLSKNLQAKNKFYKGLKNGNSNLSQLRIDYTISQFNEIVLDTERVFEELKVIKNILDQSRGDFDIENINERAQLPKLLYFDSLYKDSLIVKNSLPYFMNFINSSNQTLNEQMKSWENIKLTKVEANNRLKYYNNEIILIRQILIVMNTFLNGKINKTQYSKSINHYIIEKRKKDNLPFGEVGFIKY